METSKSVEHLQLIVITSGVVTAMTPSPVALTPRELALTPADHGIPIILATSGSMVVMMKTRSGEVTNGGVKTLLVKVEMTGSGVDPISDTGAVTTVEPIFTVTPWELTPMATESKLTLMVTT